MGRKIPHLVEVREDKFPFPVERWMVNGEIQGGNVCNCPTAMKQRSYYPSAGTKCLSKSTIPRVASKRWIRDRVDGEVLFPNGPGGTFFYGDPEFELDCVRAYNDALAEFRRVSDRFIPLAAATRQPISASSSTSSSMRTRRRPSAGASSTLRSPLFGSATIMNDCTPVRTSATAGPSATR